MDGDGQAGALERRDGEIPPRALAAAGDVEHAVGARLGDRDQRRGEVAGVCGTAELVVDYRDLVALGAEPQHRVDEVLAVRAEHPRGADDRVRRRRGGLDGALAGELRAPVGADRAGRRGFLVGRGRVAREHVVGRDVHDVRAHLGRRRRDVAGAVAVDQRRLRLGGLGAVDVGPGGAVDHRVRLRRRPRRGARLRNP